MKVKKNSILWNNLFSTNIVLGQKRLGKNAFLVSETKILSMFNSVPHLDGRLRHGKAHSPVFQAYFRIHCFFETSFDLLGTYSGPQELR